MLLYNFFQGVALSRTGFLRFPHQSALVHCFCVLMLQRGSGHKMPREIREVMGGFGHRKRFSSGSGSQKLQHRAVEQAWDQR